MQTKDCTLKCYYIYHTPKSNSMECLPSQSFEELLSRFIKSREFQFTHNALVADINILVESVSLASEQQKPVFIRALYKEFFSMVEANLYLINQFNPYDGYSDKDTIVTKL